jgi:hypothetical protein
MKVSREEFKDFMITFSEISSLDFLYDSLPDESKW